MSKFKNFVFGIMLQETDWDDPTERYWDRSPVSIDNPDSIVKKDTLYSKPINPVQKEDQVFIKCITQAVNSNLDPQVMYLTGDKNKPYTFFERNAKRFSLSVANSFIEKHPRSTFTTKYDNREYERHYEIQKA